MERSSDWKKREKTFWECKMKNFDSDRFYSEDEKLIYSGEPTKKTYPILQIIFFAVAFIGVAVTDGFLVGASVFKSIAGEDNLAGEIAQYSTAFLLHLIPLVFWAYYLLYNFFTAKNVCYVITDKRASVIKTTGKIAVETVFFSDADEIKCEKNDLVIIIKEERFVLKNLENCSDIFEKIEAIKTK